MTYLPSSFEKCKVYFKEDNFLGEITHKNYGVEVGTIDNFNPPKDYMETKNVITNFSFHSVCDDTSKYTKFVEMDRKLVEINIVSEITGKLWKMRGYLSVYLEIKSNEVILSMKSGDGKIIISDVIIYYVTI